MLITRSRSLAAIAAATLALTALAACGSDDKPKDAGAKTGASSSSSPSESASSDSDATSEASPGASTGSDDAAAAAPGERLTKDNLVPTMLAAMRDKKTAHMSMKLGSSLSADADLRYSEDKTEMKMSMDMGSTKAVVVLVDGVVYMQQSAGGKYMKIDKDTPGMGSIVEQMSGLSPNGSIEAMRGALKKVEYAGSDTVDDTVVSKYRVTADTTAMAGSLGGAAAGAGDLPKTVTYTLYVDGQNLMRRIDMTVADQDIQMLVTKWGEPVDITAPPASQVMEQ
jgi:lipoprotein LprG